MIRLKFDEENRIIFFLKMSVGTNHRINNPNNDFSISNNHIDISFINNKMALQNLNKILPRLSEIIDGSMPYDRVNRDLINKAIDTYDHALSTCSINAQPLRYNTRLCDDYHRIANISISIENEEFQTSICVIEFIFSILFPNISNYMNKFNLDKANSNSLRVAIENNMLHINGSIVFIYNFLINRAVIPIISNLRNSPYTLNEFLKNIDHRVCTDSKSEKTCAICLEDIAKNNIVSTTKCGHSYHYHCLYQCFVKSKTPPVCPCCRKLQTRGIGKSNIDLNII